VASGTIFLKPDPSTREGSGFFSQEPDHLRRVGSRTNSEGVHAANISFDHRDYRDCDAAWSHRARGPGGIHTFITTGCCEFVIKRQKPCAA
jgi:hypothetical protein